MKIPKKSLSLIQRLKTLLLSFTSAKTSPGPLSTSTAQNSPKSNPGNLYLHCSEITLEAFIDILINGNRRRLIKCGNPSKEEIDQAWEVLFYEYCDLSGTRSYRQLFSINKEIGGLNARKLTVDMCVKVLSVQAIESCKQLLRKMGYDYAFNHEDPEKYRKDLEKVKARSKSIEIALQERQAEYEKSLKGFGGKEITEEDFTKALIELSQYMGFRLKPSEITVSEYLAIRQKYEKESEYLEKAANKAQK